MNGIYLFCPCRLPTSRPALPFYDIPVDPAGVLIAAGGENDLIADHLAVTDLRNAIAGLDRAGKHLKGLLQAQLSLR